MLLITDNGAQALTYPSVTTAEHWKELTELAPDLPDEARFHVDNAIGLYRQLAAAADTVLEGNAKTKLQLARKSVEKCLEVLNDVISDPTVFDAVATGLDAQQPIPPKIIARSKRQLKQSRNIQEQLLGWCDKALARVQNKQRGPRKGRDSLIILVGLLNMVVLHYTGKRLSRSEKTNRIGADFVLAACRIANDKRQIKKSAVQEAIKDVVYDCSRNILDIGMDDSDEMYPACGTKKKARQLEVHGRANCSGMPVFIPMPGHTIIRLKQSNSRSTNRIFCRVAARRE